jgi:hypothetical protein
MTEPLSPAALAVMTAGTMGNPNVINDPVYRQCLAAALRAAAERLDVTNGECPGVTPFEIGFLKGAARCQKELLAIADELEGSNA